LGYTSGLLEEIRAAGRWLTRSAIQHSNGGVARYFRVDAGSNLPISTEITGYAVSALAHAHNLTGDAEFLDAANRAAHFLTRQAWDSRLSILPFEIDPPRFAYFFECGIVARGLIALWRSTRGCELIETAQQIGRSMASDFARHDGTFWPVLVLPAKTPAPLETARWSRVPGCYQLKSAVAWRELAAITGDAAWSKLYGNALQAALASHSGYLEGAPNAHAAMDRLHPYLYFLEALLTHPEHKGVVNEGAALARRRFCKLAPEFERADVAAQLLRVECACGGEQEDLAALAARVRSFQAPDGGYYFGRTPAGWIPHQSPVPTTFAMQALEWYERRQAVDCAAVI
jgi:hypothetical protein